MSDKQHQNFPTSNLQPDSTVKGLPFSKLALLLILILCNTPVVLEAQGSTEKRSRTGWESFAELTRGNMRFVQGLPAQHTGDYSRRSKMIGVQSPHAIVVTCSDSRVVPEILFDQGLGSLHVVRTSGFAQADVTVASVEYAVTKLDTQLIVFLVSDSCASMLAPELIGEDSVELKALKKIVEQQKIDSTPLAEKLRGKAQMAPMEIILRNISRQYIERSDLLKQRVADNKLLFAEAIFSFQSGRVDFVQVGMPEMNDFKLMFRKGKASGFQSSSLP